MKERKENEYIKRTPKDYSILLLVAERGRKRSNDPSLKRINAKLVVVINKLFIPETNPKDYSVN